MDWSCCSGGSEILAEVEVLEGGIEYRNNVSRSECYKCSS